jgi:hypothetical protein
VNDRFRNKKVFWAFVLALLSLASVPSAVLMNAFNDYYRFLTGFEPGILRPTKAFSTPRHEALTGGEEPPLHFIEFQIKAPKAKKVEVVGDFNGWKAGTLPMQRQGPGLWEIMLPLPAGRYQYHYLVDNEVMLDSKGPMRKVP